MLNAKLKSVFKIVGIVTTVVIICYLEGKYSFVAGKREQAEMSGLRILSSEFEVFGIVQGESWSSLKLLTSSLTISFL